MNNLYISFYLFKIIFHLLEHVSGAIVVPSSVSFSFDTEIFREKVAESGATIGRETCSGKQEIILKRNKNFINII